MSSRDGAADKGGLASALDAPLAVGGEVRPAIHLDIKGSTAPPTHLVSPINGIIEVKDGLLVGKAEGVAPVLVALDGTNTVVDFYHVWVRPADRLEVHGIEPSGNDVGALTERVQLINGESLRLVPHAYAGPSQLAGVARSTWVVEPPIAAVLREGLPNRIRLVAKQPGNATLKVTMLGATSNLPLQVMP
jgi:hypothetical protein